MAKRPADVLPGLPVIDTGIRQTSALQPAPQPPVQPAPPFQIDPTKIPPPPPPVKPDVWTQPGVESQAPDVLPAPEPNANAPTKPPPHLSVRPRYAGGFQSEVQKVDDRSAIIVNGGVVLIISSLSQGTPPKQQIIDIEADRMVIWTKGNGEQVFGNMKTQKGSDNGANEIFMSGHVEMRTRGDKDKKTIHADELYYDVRRNVAVARNVDFEIQMAKSIFPLHFKTPELQQLGPKLYSMKESHIFSGVLPSDPGFVVDVSNMTIEERQREKSYLYGLWPAYDKDGKRIVETDHLFKGVNYLAFLEGVPIFYFPYFTGRSGGSARAARSGQCRL